MIQKRVVCLIFLLFIFISTSSALIYFDESNLHDYNIGDEIIFSFSIEENLPIVESVETYIVCDSEPELIQKEFRNFQNKSVQDFSIYLKATEDGSCFFNIVYKDQEKSTNKFNISSKLDYNVNFNSKSFLPGESVLVDGSVSKINLDNFSYSVKVLLGNSTAKEIKFNKSNFNFNFSLPSDISSGEYSIKIIFEEYDLLGNLINRAKHGDELKIISKPTSIKIDVLEEFKPPQNLEIKTTLMDQSNVPIKNETIFLKIYDKNNEIFFEDVVESDKPINVDFPSNSLLGGWKINAFYANIDSIKPIYVNENRQLSIDFVNGSSNLVVRNVGNIPYQGVVNVKIANGSNSSNMPVNVDLGIEESSSVPLDIYGSYNLSVEGKQFDNVFITGASILEVERLNFVAIFISFLLIIILVFLSIFIRHKIKHSEKNDSSKNSFIPTKKGNVHFKRVRLDDDISKSDENSKKPKINFMPQNKEPEQKKYLYSIFFNYDDSDSDDINKLTKILLKHGLKIYKMGDMHFTLLKSSKSPENKLIDLMQKISNETKFKNLFLYSVSVENSSNVYMIFKDVRKLLREDCGIIVSGSVYDRIFNKKLFKFFKDVKFKDSLIKLYSLVLKE